LIVMRVVCLALSAVLMIAGSSRSAQPEPPSERALSQQVTELIRQLDSPSLKDRMNAEQQLLALGADALPHLPALELLRTVAQREIVRRVRIRMEHEAARESVQASHITLTGTRSLPELADEISRQTGNRFRVDDSLNGQSLSVTWQDQPYWSALRELEQSGVRAAYDPAARLMRLSRAEPPKEPPPEAAASIIQTARHEAFRLDAVPVSVQRIEATGQWLTRCSVRLRSEPRLRPLILRYALDQQTLTDERGMSLSPFNPMSRIEVPLGDGGREVQLRLDFVSDQEPQPPLKLKTAVNLLIAAAEHPVEFTRLENARGVARRRGGVTVTLREIVEEPAETGRHLRIQLRVAYDVAERAFESHQNWILYNRVRLMNAAGESLAPSDTSTIRQDREQIDLEYRFQNVAGSLSAWRLEYLAPTLLIDVPIEVEINGLTRR
jgi:hypothetical protein